MRAEESVRTPNPPFQLAPPTNSRRLAELLILSFLSIVFIRVVVVEPFGVPTGSMATTLLGNHRQLRCAHCGHRVDIGETAQEWNSFCPNCLSRDLGYAAGEDVPGDRLMVNKTAYLFRKPRRWEVAVFWCPVDYSKPYIKRVAGLPGESIQIRDGDVWIDGELARKTLPEAQACALPLWEYDSPPKPEGWSNFLRADGGEQIRLEDRSLRIETAGDMPAWCRFRNWSTENHRPEPLGDLVPYNNVAKSRTGQPVHDFLLEWTLQVDRPAGAFRAELTDGEATLVLEIRFQPTETLLRLRRGDLLLREARCPADRGSLHRYAFALIDRRASVSLDGAEWFPAFDLPAGVARTPVTEPFRIGGEGLRGTVRNLRLSRDIHYSDSGENAVVQPYRLRSGEFFMLGDNSRNSDDSRSWEKPGVPEKNFLGKPFLLHQPSRIAHFSLFGSNYHLQMIDWGRVKWIH